MAQETLKLKVAGAQQSDVGKGMVRIGLGHIRALGLSRGDVVEIKGKRVTAAVAVPASLEDEGIDAVRMDGLIRGNARVGIGEYVELKKAVWKAAQKVSLAPAKEGLRIAGSGEGLKPTLLYRPLVQGDLISTSVFNRPRQAFPTDFFSDDFFRGFFESPAFGLMEIRLVVTATLPKGTVRVSEETEIELVPEYREPEERELIEVTYDDLGGMKPVVQKVREMIELPLKHPELFDRLGIDPPKGVLLYGPPGTGKTLLAKAVAHESEAYFTAINGPEIMGKFYGESEERLRQVFAEAEKNAPAILFFDELDSLAPVRGSSLGEPQVTERVVNQLLAEMDGMEELKGVVVLGATNRPDMIDPALLRPGRFDEIVYVPIPDTTARVEIFRSHTRTMALDRDVNLEKLAEITERFTGADIAGVCMKAGLFALRENPQARSVAMEHFFRAVKEAIPSVTAEMEKEYEKLARKVKQEAVRIGFKRGE